MPLNRPTLCLRLCLSTSPRQGGFSLIEALIAMVVLSLGLLGLASLQINSLKFNQVAHLRTQAANAAYQMLDTLRASPTLATQFGGGAFTGVLATEVAAWNTEIGNRLPGGVGAICRIASPDPTGGCTNGVADDYFLITVTWNEANDQGERVTTAGANVTQTFQLVSQVAQ